MKIKIIFSLFLILLIKNSYAQAGWGSPFADSLMHLHNVANGGYKGYINIPVKDTVDSEKFQLAQILGADRAEYNKNFEYGLVVTLYYYNANPDIKKLSKQALDFFTRLKESGVYKYKVPYGNSLIITEKGRNILKYDSDDRKEEQVGLKITFYQTKNILSDEAAYEGKFPESPSANNAPQIFQITGNGLDIDSYERDNGIFANGTLVKGSKRFHGYGAYRNGIWYSDDWRTTNVQSRAAKVYFIPENTRDTIFGQFSNDFTMMQFQPDKAYGAKFKQGVLDLYKDAPDWLKTTYINVEAKRKNEEQEKMLQYRKEHPYTSTAENTNTVNKNTAPKTKTRTTCSNCNGRGRVGHNETQTQFTTTNGSAILTNRMVWESCPACGGTGYR